MAAFFNRLKHAVLQIEQESVRVKELADEEFLRSTVQFTQQDLDSLKSVEKQTKDIHAQVANLKAAILSRPFNFDRYESKLVQMEDKLKDFVEKHRLVEKHGYKPWQKPEPPAPCPEENGDHFDENEIDKRSESSSNTDSGRPDSPPVQSKYPHSSHVSEDLPDSLQHDLLITHEDMPTLASLNLGPSSTTFNCNTTISPNSTFSRDLSSVRDVTVEFTPGLTTRRPAPKARVVQAKNKLFENPSSDKASETYVKLPAPTDISMSTTFQVTASNTSTVSQNIPPTANETPSRPVSQITLDPSKQGNKLSQKQVPTIPEKIQTNIFPKPALPPMSKDVHFKVPLPPTPVQPVSTRFKSIQEMPTFNQEPSTPELPSNSFKETHPLSSFKEPNTPELPTSCIKLPQFHHL